MRFIVVPVSDAKVYGREVTELVLQLDPASLERNAFQFAIVFDRVRFRQLLREVLEQDATFGGPRIKIGQACLAIADGNPPETPSVCRLDLENELLAVVAKVAIARLGDDRLVRSPERRNDLGLSHSEEDMAQTATELDVHAGA